jgi:dipeptidyl aminopeptidase/acylaminoacyl peptidase
VLRKAIFATLGVAMVAAATWGVLHWRQLAQGGCETLLLVNGEATVLRGGATRHLSGNSASVVCGGDEIRTETRSSTVLVLTPTVSVTLGSEGVILLRHLPGEGLGDSNTSVLVQRGETSLHIRESSQPASRYEVLTAAAAVALVPGRYSVNVSKDGATVVEVSQGMAKVTAQDSEVEVWQGEFTSVDPGRAPSIPRSVVARFVYVSERAGNLDIWMLDEEGRDVQLTNDPAADLAPVWSPNGTGIAFESLRDGNSEIYVMDADGSNQINLTRQEADDHAPSWSPDGKLIAFESLRDGARELYVMNSDGSEGARLTNGPGLSVAPHWDIDGSEIIFSRIEDDSNDDGVVDLRDMAAFFSVPPTGGTAGTFWYTRFVFDEHVFPWSRRAVG